VDAVSLFKDFNALNSANLVKIQALKTVVSARSGAFPRTIKMQRVTA
jgi:hypothetical protein